METGKEKDAVKHASTNASANQTASAKETTSAKGTTSANQTASAKETTSAKQTASAKETVSAKQTVSAKGTAGGRENDELVAKVLLSDAVMWLIYKRHIVIDKWARLHSLMVMRYAAFLTRNNLSAHPHEDAALAMGFSSRKYYDECKRKVGL